MASKVGLKEAEYQGLTTIIPSLHEEILTQTGLMLDKLETLNQKDGGFYLDEITSKVNLLINELRTIKESMNSVYEVNEEIVTSFMRAIDNYDTLC